MLPNPYEPPGTDNCREVQPEEEATEYPIPRYTRHQRIVEVIFWIIATIVLAVLILPALRGVEE